MLPGTSAFVGPARIVEDVTVSEQGDTYSGTFTLDQFDTGGNTLPHIEGTVSAHRITP